MRKNRSVKWVKEVVRRTLDDYKKTGKITFLGKGKEYPLKCLGLEKNTRFKADWAVSSVRNGKVIFIEIDREGWFDHNVSKYLPYLEEDLLELKNRSVILLQLIVRDVNSSKNNYISSKKLVEWFVGKFRTFEYKDIDPFTDEKDLTTFLDSKL